MKKQFLGALSFITVLTSCSNDMEPEMVGVLSDAKEDFVTVSENGYLNFPSEELFESFFVAIQNGENPIINVQTRSASSFQSIAQLNLQLERQICEYGQNKEFTYKDDLSDLEEMTQDEYNLMKAEELLFDDILTHAMDTTLRICVAGELYKVTENGTFSVKLEKADKLDLAINNFNPSIKQTVNAGETIQLNADVKYTNTFGASSLQVADMDVEEMDESFAMTRSGASIINSFHVPYNVNSYKWKNNGMIKKFLDLIRGKDVSKSNQFSKNYRVQVNVFDVNYGFYKSAGIKVRMQEKKKFCFVPYWVGIKADKLVIGFNELEGVLKYNNPNNISNIMPTASAKWKKFQGTLNGIVSSYIYGAYHNIKFIRDWTEYAFGWMPDIKIGDKNYRNNVLNKIYNTPADQLCSFTKKIIGKTIYTPIGNKIVKPTDPMVAYLIWGTTEFKFNKERPYIMGVKEYTSRKSKSVIFDRSFGISFIGKMPAPFTPSNFDINSIDAFGAAYYNNQWRGVRFYCKK